MNCPTCRRRVNGEGNPYRPFCSERCKLLDLEGWMSERYRVPVEEETPVDSDGVKEGHEDPSNGRQ